MHDGPRKAVHKAMLLDTSGQACIGMPTMRYQAATHVKFEIPTTIITDNGTQLINDPFKSLAEGLGIKLVSTSVYHPQANGAVERANRSIMQGIKTRLHQEG
ncbi:reverse transcriptase domain-containing protein [Tanacetum coccineum]